MGLEAQSSKQKSKTIDTQITTVSYEEENSFDNDYDDDGANFMDAYGDKHITTLPIYTESTGAGITAKTVIHDKYESFTMNSLKNQLAVLNNQRGVGSSNPIENSAVNTWRNFKFLATGVLYNLTHIFSWTKRQRARKKAVVKSMGTALKNFGINAVKTVGGLAISPFAAVYGFGKYVKEKIQKKDDFIKKDSFIHNVCKKTYAYLWGGVVRNIINTTFMAGSLPFWLIGGTINTIKHLVIGNGLQGFKPAFSLPRPMLPVEWEQYYDMHSMGGGFTGLLEKSKDSATGKYERQISLSSAWGNFCTRFKSHFKRFRDANWHSFFTGDIGTDGRADDAVDYNNMQQI